MDGLIDRRLEQISNRRAPVDEVMALTELYQTRHIGWNVKHFHSWYKREGGTRSYTWIKKHLQRAKLVPKCCLPVYFEIHRQFYSGVYHREVG